MKPSWPRLFGVVLMAMGTMMCLLAYAMFEVGYTFWPAWAMLGLGVFSLWGGVMQAWYG